MFGRHDGRGNAYRFGYADSRGLFPGDGDNVASPAPFGGDVGALSLVIETIDPYTAGHQRRVARLARAIARKMELSEWQVSEVHIASLLHDIGKIAVPREILCKRGGISRYEFGLIKKHPRVGCQTLERLGFSGAVTQAILQHHERWNGSGYPAGLSGHDIILGARILAVADVVEAMSSRRPYRPALGLERAIEEILQQRGTLYDQAVASACINLLRQGRKPWLSRSASI